ncbi:translation initiation factor IF-1 [Candidatus Karelsulcia muelleri]|uniref:translation initiation factor IF-1 n=1 Tax=Candidatus Karelsulcia muelleri TaxID=336810 RepID=UPI0019525AA7|nr:translation initiation factor IF-1 [Candidatus Karelsulcia muelleri]
MTKEKYIKSKGIVKQAFPNATFKVQLKDKRIVTGYIKGKMRMNYIQIFPGDKVKLHISYYDLTKARIIYRY